MKKTYKIKLPKGANISTVETNENNGVLEVTVGFEKKYVPKDGDVVSCQGIVVIYAGTNETGGIMTYAALHEQRLQTVISERGWGYTKNFSPATEAEKQRLFDALAKEGKRWNAEKKQIEDLPRWRAKEGEQYYYVNVHGLVIMSNDFHYQYETDFHDVGNYFRTREAAEKVAEQIRDIFKNSKAE